MANLGTLTLDLVAKIGGFTGPLDKADRRVKQSQQNINSFSKAGSAAVSALGKQFVVLAATVVSVQTAIAAVKLGATFEQSLANARAVMRGTEQDMLRLSAAARLMGKTTEFSATQSAEALYALGRAGFSASEAIEALPNVLQLASAAGLDLAEAAKLTDDALDAFGLKVSDIARLNDVLVGAATRSGLKVEELAEALKTVGPVAVQLGISVEDAAALFGVLAQSGIDAGDAATQLNTAMLKNKNAAQQLGTAQGDLIGTLRAARAAGWDLNAVVAAYGPKAAKTVITLIDQIDALDKLQGELKNVSGETRSLSQIRLDTIAGDFKKLQAAMEEMGIEAFNSIRVELRGALKALIDFIQQNQQIIVTFFNIVVTALKLVATSALILVGVIELIADALAVVIVTVGEFSKGLAQLNASDLLRPDKSIGKIAKAFSNAGSAAAASSGVFADSVKKYTKALDSLWGTSDSNAQPMMNIAASVTQVSKETEKLDRVVKKGNIDWEEREELLKEGAALTKEMRSATEIHGDEMVRLNSLVDSGAISLITYSRAQKEANDALAKAIGHKAASEKVNPFGLPDEVFFGVADKLEKQKKLLEEGQQTTEGLRNATEKYSDEVNRLTELLKAGAITQEVWKRGMEAAAKALAEADTAAIEAERTRNQMLEDGVAVTKSMRTTTEEYADELKRLNELLGIGAISQETFARAQKAAGEKGFEKAPKFDEQGNLDPMGKLNEEEKELEEWYAKQLQLLSDYRAAGVGTQEQWDAKELELSQKHAEELSKIDMARTKLALSSASDLFGSLASIMATYVGESSSSYKALFALSKSFAIANSTIKLYEAIANAGASLTFPANLGAMATVAAAMAGLVSQIASVGMAHEGMDSVPQSGSWLLQKGERVTTEKTSKRLDRTLDRIDKGSQMSSGNAMNVNVYEAPGTTAQATKRDDGSLDVHIALIEEKLLERMNRGSGMAGPLDRRYGRKYY